MPPHLTVRCRHLIAVSVVWAILYLRILVTRLFIYTGEINALSVVFYDILIVLLC